MKTERPAADFQSEAFKRYEALLRELHRLEGAHKDEHAEQVRDQMDDPFMALSPIERSFFQSLSTKLYQESERHDYLTEHSGHDFVSSEVEIKGSITSEKELYIDGKVEGNIDSRGNLVLGRNADVTGEIRSQSMTIFGKVDGNITVIGRCEMKASSTLRGDMKAQRLVIEEGATFIGKSEVATTIRPAVSHTSKTRSDVRVEEDQAIA